MKLKKNVKKYNQGGKPSLTAFEKAFAEARAAGEKTFWFDRDGDGEKEEYTTKTVEEESFAKYIQPGAGDSITDRFLHTPEAEAEREARRKAQEYMDWYARSSGALTPMEGLDDPILNILLGGRMLLPRARTAAAAALGPKYNPFHRGFNLYPSQPGQLGGVQSHNIYEEIARRFGRRFGTRTTAGGGPYTKGPWGYGGKHGMGKVSDWLDDFVEQYLSSPGRATTTTGSKGSGWTGLPKTAPTVRE